MSVRQARGDDLPQIRRLEERLAPMGRQPRGTLWAEAGLQSYAEGVQVLLYGDIITGAAWCLSVKDGFVRQLRQGSLALDEVRPRDCLLSHEETVARAYTSGNACLVGMVAFDPRTQQEDYAVAIPLFASLLGQLYSVRMRTLIAQTATPLAGSILARAGAERVEDSSLEAKGAILWFFDEKTAVMHVPSGLSVVYFSMWAPPASIGRLGLSRRERELIWRAIRGATADKQLQKEMGIGPDGIKSLWGSAYRKAKEAGICKDGGDRRTLLIYCQAHPEEIQLIPE